MRPSPALVLWVALAATPAWAQNAQRSCELEANPLMFGNYDPTSGVPTDASSEIVLRCTCTGNGCGALHYGLELSSPGGRSLTADGGGRLGYEVYSDPARTQPVGQGADSYSGVYQPPLYGDRQVVPIYGRMAPLQPATAGVYTGQETVILIY